MNIVAVESLGLSREQLESIASQFRSQGHTFRYFTERDERPEALISRMQDAEVVVISNIHLSAQTLSQCPTLRFISVAFTGLDHIDLNYCKLNNITVQNAAGYSTTAVSELTIGLMIDLLRNVTEMNSLLRRGGSRGNNVGCELRGKTVGVVGTGAIGTEVIRLLTAFGCRVLAYNRSTHSDVVSMGAKYVPLEQLMKESDIVTVHLPLNDDTHHLIGEHELSLMKSTALLINTARGNVVDINATAEALNAGTIAGAAFDVYENEPPLPSTHPLLFAPNCVLLPHIGYATSEAFVTRADIVFEHVKQWLSQQ